ncbi:glycoside hydrolase family 43 protein [Cadophora sp. DSE1049]|nr:glycoside hydrolase family 43 protein [Cadophora sp. DSE1049]
MKFENPIIPGFSPDPSVVLVEDTFFLVTSTFHVFPDIPVYASKDLNTWTHINNAINRQSQLDLSNATSTDLPEHPDGSMVATAGLFAPSIHFHNGTYYILCTNTINDGKTVQTLNFYITCSDIWENNWSDPIYIDFSGIDPSFFFEDDHAYVQGSFRLHPLKRDSCAIKQFEIDIKTGKSISETKTIWDGFAKIHSEGPHIYKKDGWYYLLIAEGGTFEHHMLTIARSKNIWGPYSSYEQNPILTSDGTSEFIQGVGHGDLFQDLEGKWWAAVLGYRDAGGIYPLGRETFLTPVIWPENGWPMIAQPKLQFEREHSSQPTPKFLRQRPAERVADCYLRTPNPKHYEFSSDGRTISVAASNTDLSARRGTATFLGERQRQQVSTSTVVLRRNETQAGRTLRAGLSLFKDDVRHADIFYDYSTSSVTLAFSQRGVPAPVLLGSTLLHQNWSRLAFKIQSSTEVYEFFYQLDAIGEWVLLGSVDAIEMTARDFTGTMLGIFASGSDEGEGSIVSFEDFNVSSEASPRPLNEARL